ncbi:CBS domain protein [Oleiphilus messinensis]|uniref:CBS domain protein n=1 Tax=Oleiphilus messinensis TaxID=141451 RepID=A0A1Y0I758_9GAMM|nr:CBS domain-containing protein [Oleiphilus messinensis]ARU55274.1 CBS domain protein [Oleiphilus messinensis]
MPVYAKDIMTPNIKSVPQTWTMQQFTRFLSDNEISGSPVVDENGEIVGIATLKDVADFHFNSSSSEHEKRMTEEELKEARRLRQFIFEEMQKVPVEVRDILTPIVFSVEETCPVREVAEKMMANHLHRIFVTKDEHVSGIITTYDLLKLIVEQVELD